MQIFSKENLWISIALVTGGGTQYSMDGPVGQITHPTVGGHVTSQSEEAQRNHTYPLVI